MRVRLRWVALAIGVSVALGACNGGSSSGSGANGTTPSPASAASVPATGALITGQRAIVVQFDRSMDPATLSLGGTMAPEATSAWSQSVAANDRLAISPSSAWSSGSGRTLTVDAADAQGIAIAQVNLSYDIDAILPTLLSVTPADAATISRTQQVVVRFSESMAVGSLALGGILAPEAAAGVWSSTSVANDTLTVSPAVEWAGGSARTLNVGASDLAGNAAAVLQLSYTVDTTAPSAVPSTPNGSIITRTQGIVITFSKSMEPSSLVLGGTLAPQSTGGVWSTTVQANDTLTVAPASAWSAAISTLSLSVSDNLGNPLPPLNLTYDADVVFVSSTGLDTDPGTHSQPLRNVPAGIAKATGLGVLNVWIGAGTFNGVVSLASGVNLKGGLDGAWNPGVGQTNMAGTLDADGQYLTVKARNITSPTLLSRITIVGPNAPSLGQCNAVACSSYALHAVDSTGLALDQVSIIGGNAASGFAGANATQTAPTTAAPTGGAGGNAQSFVTACNDTSRGTQGSAGTNPLLSLANGGAGGLGGTMDTFCVSPVLNSNFNATGGSAGSNAVRNNGLLLGTGGLAGTVCGPGGAGRPGVPANNGGGGLRVSADFGGVGVIVANYLVPPGNGTNGQLGTDGGGGGGGGGSGGCDTGTDAFGAGGGGGGAGGVRSNSTGAGGKAGGSSFGIFAVNSTVALTSVTILRGAAGNGGAGGAGSAGQPGGAGGPGGLPAGGAMAGGSGGAGSSGGHSGGGAGGAGGSSFGVFSVNSTVSAASVSGGVPGGGGAVGGGPGVPGQSGSAGFLVDSFVR